MDHSVLSYIELQAPSWLTVYSWYFSVHIFKDDHLVIWTQLLSCELLLLWHLLLPDMTTHLHKMCWHFNLSIFVVWRVAKVVKMLCVCQCFARVRLWQHSERDSSFGPFQDADGFFMCDPLQSLPVNGHYLVSSLQTPVLCCCPLSTYVGFWLVTHNMGVVLSYICCNTSHLPFRKLF